MPSPWHTGPTAARLWHDRGVRLADIYRRFASFEARGESPVYQRWAEGVAGDDALLAMIDELGGLNRQPQLVFAAARYAGIPAGPFADFRAALVAAWPTVRGIVLTRRNQTNEPGRCAALLPLLAALPQPLALLEVGASAGLGLYPDRYTYAYGEHHVAPVDGPSAVRLACTVTGPVPLPTRLPTVVWRVGIDLNPLDVRDPADVRWLDALIWPGQEFRRQRLAAAVDVVRADPPRLVRGDLVDALPAVAAEAPPDATLVVFDTAVLTYLTPEARAAYVATVRGLDCHWLSFEGPSVAPLACGSVPPSPDPSTALFVVEADGVPVAHAGGHGQSLHWFDRC